MKTITKARVPFQNRTQSNVYEKEREREKETKKKRSGFFKRNRMVKV